MIRDEFSIQKFILAMLELETGLLSMKFEGEKCAVSFSENFGTCHLLEETLCHERPFFTKQLSRVVQKLLLCHLRRHKKNTYKSLRDGFTRPLGHIFLKT